MKDIHFESEGVNLTPELGQRDYDFHCPLMGNKRNNYYWSSCFQRQANPLCEETCYPHCKIEGYAGPLPRSLGEGEDK